MDEVLTVEEAAPPMKMSIHYVRRLAAQRRIAFSQGRPLRGRALGQGQEGR
ncbi:hypothetical protein [Micromonospora sp. WMMD980]|uniref:hypothetical protein n=1 Tax=Micromonospora sp. WMMD980 TaxID=3016088 RepID=UPI002417BEB2|nr:hypothetical protein [Micromonospora sp. WMMD980]MDG4803920.1 hypothetical protein [Micromonospora sp. WMMD980]